MAGICRVGVDTAGGTIISSPVSTVFVNGALVAGIGSAISSHGDSPHSSASMAVGSSTVFADGVAVCRAGDTATCGHTASGSLTVNAG